jgi:glycosyltransferase involved in cell wall biosynthesis
MRERSGRRRERGGKAILLIGKYPPIEGGVSAHDYWLAQVFAELGRRVIVLTNADEVEAAYRMRLTPLDRKKLGGYRVPGGVTVVSTQTDEQIFFVPEVNPHLTKLVSLGLALVRKHRPQFLFCSYLEPYGMAGLSISRLTGVPYVIQHAGSDIGRLIYSPQLHDAYCAVLQNAAAVLTVPSLGPRLRLFGVRPERMVLPVHCRLPEDVFYPARLGRRPGEELRLVCYGKVGETKGTAQLLQAIDECRRDGLRVKLITHWGGVGMEAYRSYLSGARLRRAVSWRGFVPHWRIADALRSAHVGIFLENGFDISFHTPIGPLECWACGRPAILSEELMGKHYIADNAVPGVNCFIAGGTPPGIPQLKRAIGQAFEAVTYRGGGLMAPAKELYPIDIYKSTTRMLAEIGARLPKR